MWQFIIDNIWSILGVLVAIAGVLVGKFFPNTKVAKGVQVMLKVFKSLPEYIRQAEKVSEDPEARKMYVLNQFILNAQANGYTPSEQDLADVSERIDDQVKLTKDINLSSKSTTTATTIKPIQHLGGSNGQES